ncbi:hypothetical protein POM88_010138 [Heracleum sosnowskyi]|uniref:Uncharacterized protein n=1 Tax=Heracleum sosnowskyi TaxID=360622 RepID=A0AAD8N3E1_9APIA|nr:hypothetical protein POM88_010138 [Heracleum sosnowskyi]
MILAGQNFMCSGLLNEELNQVSDELTSRSTSLRRIQKHSYVVGLQKYCRGSCNFICFKNMAIKFVTRELQGTVVNLKICCWTWPKALLFRLPCVIRQGIQRRQTEQDKSECCTHSVIFLTSNATRLAACSSFLLSRHVGKLLAQHFTVPLFSYLRN